MVIGITGGIGSGKTAVCKLLEQHGASVFYADQQAQRLMQTDPIVRTALEAAFGTETWLDDGSLNRTYLASVIFNSEERRLQMNEIVHPAVREAFTSFRQKQERLGKKLIVKEAALLFESGTQDLDAIVVVDAPINQRVQRVMMRDGLTEEQVQQRIKGQMPAHKMRDKADIVINNEGPIKLLKTEVSRLLTFLHGIPTA